MISLRHLTKHDIALYCACISFAADSIINYVSSAPIFVASIPLLAALSLLAIKSQRVFFVTLIAILFTLSSFLFNAARFGISQDNVSDVLFLILAISFIGACLTGSPTRRAMSLMSALFALLFIPAFFGINNQFGSTDALTSGSSDIEFLRSYQQGLYRLPHLAAYLLAFGAIWWFILWEKERKILQAITALAFVIACLYTGSRTPAFIFIIGFVASYFEFSPKKIAALLVAIAAIIAVVINIDAIMAATEGSFIYQYPSAVKTALTNFERLSRVMIWTSWYDAMKEFGPLDYLIGRSFAQSLHYNEVHLGLSIWFHNDYLSIIYSYGAPVFLTYTAFTLATVKKLSRENSSRAKTALVAFILVSGLINGFYKYLPIVFLFALSFIYFNVKNESDEVHNGA